MSSSLFNLLLPSPVIHFDAHIPPPVANGIPSKLDSMSLWFVPSLAHYLFGFIFGKGSTYVDQAEH